MLLTDQQWNDIEDFFKNKNFMSSTIETEDILTGDNIVKYGINFYSENGFYSYAQYLSQELSYWPYNNTFTIGFSGEFSGCTLVKFFVNNNWYIGHMSIESGSIWGWDKWNEFIQKNNVQKYYMFKPYRDSIQEIMERIVWNNKDPYSCNCIGIIGNDNHCYSAIFDKKKNKIVYAVLWDNIEENQFTGRQRDAYTVINHLDL